MKIPSKYQNLLFAAMMGFFMSIFMSGAILWINTGLDHQFLLRWARAITVSFPISVPLVILLAPLVRTCVARVTG
ncbi:MAG: DUF2798 domain-containing protein [Gammaproteobacteria bacterium]|nr:DUF2798 domain-containing protein [Gammaproteobacteria bacterium]